jgi:hypothetical protein
MTAADRRDFSNPVRVTLAPVLGDHLDGAWWPYTASVARELPQLIDALTSRLGEVIDISVNWSALEGAPSLNPLPYAGKGTLPGQVIRQQRIITVVGRQARVNLLVVPSRTGRALAVMVLRHAASLPILASHAETAACRTAEEIVRTARAEAAKRAAAESRNTSADSVAD